jgi:YggT family protein
MAILITIVSFLFQFYAFLILIRVLLTWVSVNRYSPIDHPLIRILNRVTDPVLEPLRQIIPPLGGVIDISPVIALVLLEILRAIVLTLLSRL